MSVTAGTLSGEYQVRLFGRAVQGGLTESFLLGFKWRITAHRLATTEQSVVMSCTRSLLVLATMIFSNNSGPESLKISAGRFQPAKISFCFLEKENSEGSLGRGRLDEFRELRG